MCDIILYVGMDDTDSQSGMCTTYICAVVVERLKACGFSLQQEPLLIRLNPFAPFKTRGNGAVSFKLILKDYDELKSVKHIILTTVEEWAELADPRTNPGVIFYTGKITSKLKDYSLKTVRTMVSLEEAENVAQEEGVEVFKFKNGRGLIGALASIACPLDDYTYELLAYRSSENYGCKRSIDEDSVRKMNQCTYPYTFDNLDGGYMAIEPHTPCPVLYGIRGESIEAVSKAQKMVVVGEPLERIMIFKTNQHTDQHIQEAPNIKSMQQFQCYRLEGAVADYPHVIPGGHVIFTLKDHSGKIECAAYEPTKGFRDRVRQLIPGDKLVVYGGIGRKGTLNLEKIQVLKLADFYDTKNPLCTNCEKRMKSAGKDQGYKCPRCGFKSKELEMERSLIPRHLKEGFYEVPPSARRHLSKPLIRMGISD